MKVEAGGTKHYYHQDSNFRIAALTDSTGAVAERYIYTPYGQRIILDAAGTTVLPASAVNNTRGHQGLRHDEETGLVYNRARYLDPVLGRFIGRDPLGYVDGMSRFQMYGGNPVNRLDPTGLAEFIYAFSGIIADENYVANQLRGWGFDPVAEEWMYSRIGTEIIWNLLFGNAEQVLDREAKEFTERGVDAGCRCGEGDAREIRVLMIAPKTNTLPPNAGCCNVQVTTLWSDRDGVPNQEWGNPNNQSFWQQYGGPNRTFNVDPPGNVFEDHSFSGYLNEPPQRVRGHSPRYRTAPNLTAPNARSLVGRWMRDPNIDDVIVCHSQGCNIAMHALRRACSPT